MICALPFHSPQKDVAITIRDLFNLCLLLCQLNLQQDRFISLKFHVVKLDKVSAQLIQALQFICALFHGPKCYSDG